MNFNLFLQVCKYDICTLAADYKSKKSAINAFFFSLETSNLKAITERIGLHTTNFSESKHFADAITHWVETNCFCLDIDSV